VLAKSNRPPYIKTTNMESKLVTSLLLEITGLDIGDKSVAVLNPKMIFEINRRSKNDSSNR
jgi:hypothetical protein